MMFIEVPAFSAMSAISTPLAIRLLMLMWRKEVRVSGLEGMSREELEKKLEELSKKIDGHNAKTIEAKATDVFEES